MEWVRGEAIGRGSFSTVNLAVRRSDCTRIPPLTAVKSCEISKSSSLQKEKEILNKLRDCPEIVCCFGDDLTVENGESLYNIFLEFAIKGTLYDVVKKSYGRLLESDIRRYTRSILRGICYIHKQGYVHCDLKLQNILLCSSPNGSEIVKIADFGLAKKVGQRKNSENEVLGLRGTPLCMSPESIVRSEQEPPSDIWSLGCVISEMVTGKSAWKCRSYSDVSALLFRIGFGEELPDIPVEFSEQGKDFLSRCFVRDASKRWTAEMLLNHPFICDESISLPESEKASTSPKSAFDFPDWNSQNSFSFNSDPFSPSSFLSDFSPFERELNRTNSSSFSYSSSSPAPVNRIGQLSTQRELNWSSSDNWVTVRRAESPVLVRENEQLR